MAQMQVKSHGQVTTTKTRSIALARMQMQEAAATAKELGYTMVGSAPDLMIFVCERHTQQLPDGADFCYIVAANKG